MCDTEMLLDDISDLEAELYELVDRVTALRADNERLRWALVKIHNVARLGNSSTAADMAAFALMTSEAREAAEREKPWIA